MKVLRLLEQLNVPADERKLDKAYQVEMDLIPSLIDHLQRLLNTRRGSVPIDARYGVPDFSKMPGGLANPDTSLLANEIRETVTHFEPRLKHVEVSFGTLDTSRLAIPFRIHGRTAIKQVATTVELRGAVLSDGRIDFEAPGA